MDTQNRNDGEVAAQIAQAAGTAAASGRRFVLALSPASISQPLMDRLAQEKSIRSITHVFLADTRFKACGRSAAELRAMLERLPVRRSNLHLGVADLSDPVRAAGAYEQELRAFFGLAIGHLPRFDAIVLQSWAGEAVARLPGQGNTADEECRIVTANRACEGGDGFVTLTAPVIRRAGQLYVTECSASDWRTAA